MIGELARLLVWLLLMAIGLMVLLAAAGSCAP